MTVSPNEEAGPTVAPADETVEAAIETVKSEAAPLIEPIRERLDEVAREEKALGADRLIVLARALHGAANGLDAEMPALARHVRDTGSWVEASAGHVRDQKFETLFGEVGDFARKNPTVAFAAAALSGLALARFLKSTKPPSQ